MGHKQLKVVVLGAGPAGLSAAWNLVQDGHQVLVLEKEPVWGGQSLTFTDGEYRFDLGPHNIHSSRLAIIDFVSEQLRGEWFERRLHSEILFRGQRVAYPLVGTQVLRFLPKGTAMLCAISFLWRRIGSLLSSKFEDDGTYETWVINRFGKRFYDIFFGPYTFKTWGIPPAELSDIIAKKRISVRSLTELIKSIIFTSEPHHVEDPRKGRHGYCRHGIGKVSDFFAEGTLAFGAEIFTQACIKTLKFDRNRISSISYELRGKEQTISFDANLGRESPWEVVSTIPLNDLIRSIEGEVPPRVMAAAQSLDFTSEVFLYLKFSTEDVFGVPLLYFSELEYPFTRAYDIGLFSRDMVPKGKNAVCLELTCRFGDSTWTLSDKDVFEKCIEPLTRNGLIDRRHIEGYVVKRLKHAYPLLRVGIQEKLGQIFDFIHSIENLVSVGRQGMFSYANVDEVIWMGFQIAKNLPYQKRMKLRIEDLLPDTMDY